MLRYAITDRTQLGAQETVRRAALLACVARWAELGIDFIQLREKNLPAAQLLALTRDLRALLNARSSPAKLLLNAPPELARAAAADIDGLIDGLHLTASHAVTPAQARQLLAASPAFRQRTPLVSISCHSLDQVQAAAQGGADLILFGPVFGKSVLLPAPPESGRTESAPPAPAYRTVTPPIGLEALRAACALAGPTPVLALGGVTPGNTALCLEAGAAGIAAIRLFQQIDHR